LHFALPFIILGLAIVHIALLHEFGSTNRISIPFIYDKIPFSPYYVLKDAFSIIFVLIFLCLIIGISPDMLGHSLNYELANFLVTPVHIVPE
jgi:quinol-cytochrome oxidoreductase complex cytochrome b subunit